MGTSFHTIVVLMSQSSDVTDIRVMVEYSKIKKWFMVIVSQVSHTIKPGLGMGCHYSQDQKNIFVTETRIYS